VETIEFMGQTLPVDTESVFSDGVDIGLADVEALRALPNLRWLNLGTTDTTDEHLRVVGSLTTLVDLDLSLTDITDAGLAHLTGLTELTGLSLKETRITGWTLDRLRPLANLRSLNLKGIELGDDCLQHVAALPNLEFVIFSSSRLTLGALESLKTRLPDCDITNQSDDPEDTVVL